MVALTIRLFGRFDACCGNQPIGALNARRARALLCYLVLHRNHPQRRETLASLLWDDAPPEQASKYLRQALWQIQTALRPLVEGEFAHPLEVDPEWIQLNSCEYLSVDVARFEQATHSCHGIPGALLDDPGRQQLEDAVSLYRGDLMEGCYQDWCLFERERLQNDFLDALEKLVCSCEARSESERGLVHAKRMLALDPAREQVHRHVMQLYLLAGNRTQALRQFQRCERVLLQELGIQPSPQTRALYESIRTGRLDCPWPDRGALGVNGGPGVPYDQLPALADLLKGVQQLFTRMETRLQQDIAVSAAPRVEPD